MFSTQAQSIIWSHILPTQYPSLGTHIFLGPSSPKKHFCPSPHHFPRPTFSLRNVFSKGISSLDPISLLGRHFIPKPHHFLGPTFYLAIIHPQGLCKWVKFWPSIITILREVRLKEQGKCLSVQKRNYLYLLALIQLFK